MTLPALLPSLARLSLPHFEEANALSILDRYVLRSFLEPFFMCFFGFLAIWLIFDLSDNGPDFIQASASPMVVAGFYATQLPAIVMIVLPVGLLLALLFSLSRMSRTNELIAQLTAGRSIYRILAPLLLVGLACTGVLWWLNQELAPRADAIKKTALEQIQRGKVKAERDTLEAHVFKDRQTNRTWFVRKLRLSDMSFQHPVIIQQDAEGNILTKWYANTAAWDATTGHWTLERGLRVEFDTEGNETDRKPFLWEPMMVTGWTETPWRIASANFDPQNLSVAELKRYLEVNHDFPWVNLAAFATYLEHRKAMPWTCFVVVLIAAPLGIVFNRRGVLAGVASSIFIFFGMVFLTDLFLALGKGARVSPWTAAWTPNLLIGIIGIFLLWMRNSNREVPHLFAKRR